MLDAAFEVRGAGRGAREEEVEEGEGEDGEEEDGEGVAAAQRAHGHGGRRRVFEGLLSRHVCMLARKSIWSVVCMGDVKSMGLWMEA